MDSHNQTEHLRTPNTEHPSTNQQNSNSLTAQPTPTMIRRCFLLAAVTAGASGFTLPSTSTSHTHRKASHVFASKNKHDLESVGQFDPLNLSDESSTRPAPTAALAAAAAALLSSPLSANAAGPDWGVFEGRTGSLLHPIAMFSMAAMSASTALLGFQWRRQRTLGDEISALKKTLPDLGGASSVSDALAAAQSAETVDSALVSRLKAALPVESEINALTKERKDLANAGPRDKHFNQGSLLLFIGIAFAIEVRAFIPHIRVVPLPLHLLRNNTFILPTFCNETGLYLIY
jgi:hypothetical protein